MHRIGTLPMTGIPHDAPRLSPAWVSTMTSKLAAPIACEHRRSPSGGPRLPAEGRRARPRLKGMFSLVGARIMQAWSRAGVALGDAPCRARTVDRRWERGDARTAVRGLGPVGSYRSATENVDEDIVSFGTGRQHCEIDLMQPVDPKAKPRVDEPPLNHIGLWVDDLAAAYAWLSARGVRFAAGGIRTGAAGHDVCFVHPKGDLKSPVGGEGVLIELVQAPAAVIDALGGGPE